MSIFDLQKRQEAVKFVLEKRNIANAPTMRVGVALDVSGSARNIYSNGTMQATIDRLIPIAMRFDDNGELDVWSFDTGCAQLASVSKQDYEGFIQREIMSNSQISKWGGTYYAPPLEKMMQFYFGGSKMADKTPKANGFLGGLFGKKEASPATPATTPHSVSLPAMALFITDGANSDRREAEAVIRASQDKPIYWQLIGVGNPSEFGFLRQMADELPNAGFVHMSSLSMSDEQLYDALLSQELADFVKKL